MFVGRTADYILRDKKNLLSIFISAKMDDRIKAVCKRNALSRAEARKLINDGESNRASYYNFYTGKEWGHSSSYDICVNSSILGLEQTEQFLADFIRKRFGL